MIASVRGEVVVRRPDHVVIETAGVGYRLAVSANTLRAIPAAGQEAFLHTHLAMRDDAMSLFGFASEEERDLFLMLTSVSGIGPKVAQAILSGGTARELIRAIAAGDLDTFQAYPGVGRKTAQRIIVELRDKVGEAEDGDVPGATLPGDEDPLVLARAGLVGLGYSPDEAARLLEGATGESPEDLIASALRAGATR